jgi:glycogen debranching enzyme
MMIGPPWDRGAPSAGERGVVPRFEKPESPLALAAAVRPWAYAEASGRKAAALGREDGTFEAWVYPLKVLHDFGLTFQTPAYAEPIPGTALATTIDVRPEGVAVRFVHAAFTVEATWLVGVDAPGGLVLLDVDTSVPLTIGVRFRPDLKPMWPAALGGQYSYWDADAHAYVIGEAGRQHAALVGCPLAVAPPEQPAHNLPDAPLQFQVPVTPEVGRQGLVPIAWAAARGGGLQAARDAYARVLQDPGADWRASAAHYARLRNELTSIESPDPAIDRALEWGKVALDKGYVCNPDLGCGLLAGLGPSGTTERPGFGWFFGGDAFMNAWAMTAYGDLETTHAVLAFFAKYQRADGKMPHEISQGAGLLDWFGTFPYAYYHADTTPLFVSAVADWARASGDVSRARALWPQVKKAFEYCRTTDEDGDGLMDNTKAGLAAVETGKLRSRDVQTDVYLAAVWIDAARAAARLARTLGDTASAVEAGDVYQKARAAFDRRFVSAAQGGIPFALMKDGSMQGESTVWPSVALWRGVVDPARPAVSQALDLLASPGIAADWGARMVTRDSPQYEPLSYNNGAVWPFVTGFAALGLYEHGRADAAWQYVEALGELATLESRGYTAELFSGDRLKSVDAAVPHQLFATSGFVSGLLRGTIGFDAAPASAEARGGGLLVRPSLPPAWDRVRVRRLRWGAHSIDLAVSRDARTVRLEAEVRPGPLPLRIELALPPGSDPAHVVLEGTVSGHAQVQRPVRTAGVVVAPRREALVPGARSSLLRVLDTRRDGPDVLVRVAGLGDTTSIVDLWPASAAASVTGMGARVDIVEPGGPSGPAALRVVLESAGTSPWREATLRVKVR